MNYYSELEQSQAMKPQITAYGTISAMKPSTSASFMPGGNKRKHISYMVPMDNLSKAETVKKMPLRKLVNSVYRQQKRISYESYLYNRPVQTNYY